MWVGMGWGQRPPMPLAKDHTLRCLPFVFLLLVLFCYTHTPYFSTLACKEEEATVVLAGWEKWGSPTLLLSRSKLGLGVQCVHCGLVPNGSLFFCSRRRPGPPLVGQWWAFLKIKKKRERDYLCNSIVVGFVLRGGGLSFFFFKKTLN